MNKEACKTVVVRGVMRCFVQSATCAAPGGKNQNQETINPWKCRGCFFLLINMKVISRWYSFNTYVRTDEVGQRSLPAPLGLW